MNDITQHRQGESPFDSIHRQTPEGGEFWSARDLQAVTEYARWEDFMKLVERAKASAANTGANVDQAFSVITEKGAGRPRVDVHLSRYAAYLTVMNGDPNMPRIAEAQAYFAIRTREAETRPAIELSRRDILTMALEAEDRADREAAARSEAEHRAHALEAPASAWSHMAAAAGDYAVGDAAKILSRDPNISIGRDRLFRFMQAEGWIYRAQDRRKSWTAYQTQVDCGRLVEKMGKPYLNEKTGETELPAPTIRITAKGLAELHKRLGGTAVLATMAVSA